MDGVGEFSENGDHPFEIVSSEVFSESVHPSLGVLSNHLPYI